MKITPRSKRTRPDRILVYGPEGVGKTTFAEGAPDPLILDLDGGSGENEFMRLEQDPQTWPELVEVVEKLMNDEQPFGTLVLDTLDAMERMLYAYLVEKEPKAADIQEGAFAYGRGFAKGLEEWRKLLVRLELLQRRRQCIIITTCHSRQRTFNNPLGPDFDRYELSIQQSKSTDTAGMLKAWHDSVLFCDFETLVVTENKGQLNEKSKGVGNLRETVPRFMFTERRAAFDAKSRHDLPFKLPLSWEEYEQHSKPRTCEDLVEEIETYLSDLDQEKSKKAEEYLEKHRQDHGKLVELKNRILTMKETD